MSYHCDIRVIVSSAFARIHATPFRYARMIFRIDSGSFSMKSWLAITPENVNAGSMSVSLAT